MQKLDELQAKAKKYIEKEMGQEQLISDLIFRQDGDNYYAGFLVLEINEKNEIKRPTKWLLLEIETGKLKGFYDIKDYDYSDTDTLPLDKTFLAEGNAELFEYSNFITRSFFDWKNTILSAIQEKNSDNEKILYIQNEMISPNEFVNNTVNSLLDDIKSKLNENLQGTISSSLNNSYYYYVNKIIDDYKTSKTINREDNQNYLLLLKYVWNNLSELIDGFNNIN
jgi:hypothetical protein